MSGYLSGILTLLCINVVLAYGVFLPVATGQLNLGGAGFMAVGAYVSGLIASSFDLGPSLSIPLGAAAAGAVGFLISFPVLRTRGVYMVLATFAFAEVVSGVIINSQALGGAMGMTVPGYIDLGFIFPVTVGAVLFVFFVMGTRTGLEMRAIHDDEVVTDLLGVEVRLVQVFAFAAGGMLAGLAGGLYAHHFGFVEIQSFNALVSIYVLLYVLFGGTQTAWGPLVGAAFFTLLPELLRTTLPVLFRAIEQATGVAGLFPARPDDGWRFVVLGLVMIVMMIIRPEGAITRGMFAGWLRRGAVPAQLGSGIAR